jgi:hypothetical protein
MKLWWLSFADPHKPEGQQFLGCAVMAGADLGAAARNAHVFGCNPGGEVLGVEFPEDLAALVPARWRRRLLSREDVAAFDAELRAAKAAAP